MTSLVDAAVETGCCCRHTGNELHAPRRVCSTDPPQRWSEYEHLVPLHAQHAALPEGHVDRERLRAELIAGYLPVARNIARRYGNRGESLDDVQQVAAVGLVLAVDRFQPGLGFDFLSFAVPTITGEVLRHFRDRTHAIRIPRRLRTLQAMIYAAAAELEQRNGRSARPSEIAERLGVDLEVVIEALAAQGAGRPGSLDEPAREVRLGTVHARDVPDLCPDGGGDRGSHRYSEAGPRRTAYAGHAGQE